MDNNTNKDELRDAINSGFNEVIESQDIFRLMDELSQKLDPSIRSKMRTEMFSNSPDSLTSMLGEHINYNINRGESARMQLRAMTMDELQEEIAKTNRRVSVLDKHIEERENAIDVLLNGMTQTIKMMSGEIVDKAKVEILEYQFERLTLISNLEILRDKLAIFNPEN